MPYAHRSGFSGTMNLPMAVNVSFASTVCAHHFSSTRDMLLIEHWNRMCRFINLHDELFPTRRRREAPIMYPGHVAHSRFGSSHLISFQGTFHMSDNGGLSSFVDVAQTSKVCSSGWLQLQSVRMMLIQPSVREKRRSAPPIISPRID